MTNREGTPNRDQDEQNARAAYLNVFHFPSDTPGLENVTTEELVEMAYNMRALDNGAPLLGASGDVPLLLPRIEDYPENVEYDVRELPPASPPWGSD